MSNYRPEIDGLRSFAILPVLLSHAGFTFFAGGYVGVDVFFVISGFLISSQIMGNTLQGKFGFVDFYMRRVRRILPASYFMLICVIPFAILWMRPEQFEDFSRSMFATVTFWANQYFYDSTGYFELNAAKKPLLHMWSLSIEEQFYFVFPLVAFFSIRYIHNLKLITAIVVIALIASFAYGLKLLPNDPDAAYFFTVARVWELLIGVCCALVALKFTMPKNLSVIAFIGLSAIIFSILVFDHNTNFPGYAALLPTIGAALVILFAKDGNAAARFLAWRPFVFFGLISYSLYLFHQPIFALARLRSFDEPSQLVFVVLILLSILMATISYRYVEQPFRKKGQISRNLVFSGAVVFALIFVVLGELGSTKVVRPYMNEAAVLAQQEISHARAMRRSITFNNVCHGRVPKTDKALERYLSKWNCTPQAVSEVKGRPLKPTKIMVIGDSHASDIANALRMNGLGISQITVNAMPLANANIEQYPGRYKRLLKFAQKKADKINPDIIILTNRSQLGERLGNPIVHTWGRFGDKVVFLTSRPEYPDFEDKYVFNHRFGGNQAYEMNIETAKYSERAVFVDKYKKAGFHVVNGRKLYCEINKCAPILEDGELRLVDYGHFSAQGAKAYGELLIRELCKIQDREFCNNQAKRKRAKSDP